MPSSTTAGLEPGAFAVQMGGTCQVAGAIKVARLKVDVARRATGLPGGSRSRCCCAGLWGAVPHVLKLLLELTAASEGLNGRD